MAEFETVFLLTGFYPLLVALRANRTTTLRQPLFWALAAWTAWLGVAVSRVLYPESEAPTMAYLALCLTGCSGIAVLGARRPGVSAWNFVVVGLLAVLLLPILKGFGEVRLEAAQEWFLIGTLLVPLVNYLPTRGAVGVVLLASGCGVEILRLRGGSAPLWLGSWLLALAPWAAWLGLTRPSPRGNSEFDRLWLAYRDRFGFVWGQRMREQFNRAAHHAGWPVELRWTGLYPATESLEYVATLRAVLKRFGQEDSPL